MNRRKFLTRTGGAALGAMGLLAGRVLYDDKPLEAAEVDPELSEDAGMGLTDRAGMRRIIWSVDTKDPVVALTFDDGPDPEFTPRLLDILDEYAIPATFDVMGFNALQHADLLREESKRGYEIGNHTWSHRDLAYQSPRITRSEIARAKEAIEESARIQTRYFRPPRGELTGLAARDAALMGYDILLWSVTRGPGNADEREVAAHVSKTMRRGDVVCFHDGLGRETFNRNTVAADVLRRRRDTEFRALPRIIEDALDRGLRFVTVSDLVASDVGRL